MILSFICFRSVSSASEIQGPINPLCCPQSQGWSRPSIGKEWSLIHNRDLLFSFAPSAVSRNDPTNHASSVGVAPMFPFQSCRTEASLWLLINAMLHSESSLPWRPPAVYIWDTFAHSKTTHPDRIAYSRAWAQWCGLGRMGRDPVSWEGIGSVPDYPLRRGNLSWRDQLNRGVKKSIWNNLTLDILVKASRKLLELTGAFLHFCFN